jgi:iron complex outermembrane receptor protein
MKKRETFPLNGALMLCITLIMSTSGAKTVQADNIRQQKNLLQTEIPDKGKAQEVKQTANSPGSNFATNNPNSNFATNNPNSNIATNNPNSNSGSNFATNNPNSNSGSNFATNNPNSNSGSSSIMDDTLKIEIDTAYVNLNEIILSASYVRERQSPLRITTVERGDIERKAGGVTFPELVKDIPGVYATSETGSYGDAKINIRGFKQENISVLLNGIPISGLVTGNMFWNNWLGLTDATHSIQVQKGIGASMLSDNSVGGTINIITKTTDIKPSASTGLFYTSYGQAKSFLNLNTGENKRGWSLSAMASYTWGEGYPDMTDVSSWAYMFNVSKRINRKHSLLFTALGSPERHQQRSARLSAEETANYGLRYNKNWGYLNGETKNLSENFYHKPYFTLHHFYKPSAKTEISNSIYLSTGNGGGRWSESKGKRIIDYRTTVAQTYPNNSVGANSKNGPLIDWAAIVAENKTIASGADAAQLLPGGSARNILSDYLAGHTQTGFKSNISYTPAGGWNFTSGVHYQNYRTWERERITDLLGATYWYEDYQNKSLAGVAGRDPIKRIGDYVRTNNGKVINHLTLYSTANYKDKLWDIRLGTSLMGSTNQRWDKYNYTNNIYSETASAQGYSVKAGANRKTGIATSFYINAAYYSRVPYNELFFSSGNNNITEDVRNEKNTLAETGLRHLFQRGSIEFTFYYALWQNKSIISNPYIQPDNTTLRYLIRGLDALHYGVEINATYNPVRALNLSAYASFANWRWKNDVSANIYDEYSGVIKDVINVYSNGLPVGDAPQTQLAAFAQFSAGKGLTINADWRFNGRMYADFDPKERQSAQDRVNPFRLPDYSLTSIGVTWTRAIGNFNTTFYANIHNLFNTQYIERGRDGYDHTIETFRGFWGAGRNLGAGVRVRF